MTSTAEHAPAVPDWLAGHYALVDAGHLDDYTADFANDVEVQFGPAPILRGKDAVRAALQRGHEEHEMRHEFRNVWLADSTTIVEFSVTYTYPDGSTRTTPVVTILDRPDGLVTSMRVFLDRGDR